MQTDEHELQIKLVTWLSRFFKVETEVGSKDGKSRIDIAMIHISDIEGKYPIGIEIKTDTKKTGSTLGGWLHQAISYTEQEFNGYGRLMIVTYPQITGRCLAEGDLMSQHNVYEHGSHACQNNVNTFIAQFNIGELQKYRFNQIEYARIVFNSKAVWNSRGDLFKPNFYLFGCQR